MAKNNQIEVNGIDIKYKKINKADYISLTDIARYKNPNEPRFTVYNWLRNKETLRFLCVWEGLNNPDFNRVEFDTVTKDAGTNAFMITPSQWIEKLNGIGLTVSAGRYNSGVYAHRDIAFEFASWYNQTYEVSSMNCLTALIEILRLHELSLSAHELHFVHEGNSNHDAARQFMAERQFTTALLSNHAAYPASCQLSLDKNAEMEYNENTKKLPGNGHFLIDS